MAGNQRRKSKTELHSLYLNNPLAVILENKKGFLIKKSILIDNCHYFYNEKT